MHVSFISVKCLMKHSVRDLYFVSAGFGFRPGNLLCCCFTFSSASPHNRWKLILNYTTIISRVYVFESVKNISHLTPDKASGVTCSSIWLRTAAVDDMVNSQEFYW